MILLREDKALALLKQLANRPITTQRKLSDFLDSITPVELKALKNFAETYPNKVIDEIVIMSEKSQALIKEFFKLNKEEYK